MKVLFVVPYTPNLIRVRPYNLIRFLAARGNRVDLVTLANTEQDLQDAAQLRAFCSEVTTFALPQWRSLLNSLSALTRGLPMQAVYSWNPALSVFLRQQARSGGYDVIHVEHLRGAEYGLDLLAGDGFPPVVWDSVDCISLLFGMAARRSKRMVNRLLTRFELARTRSYEARVQARFNQILVTSRIDRDAFLELQRAGKRAVPITVLPNGVDVDYYTPEPSITREPETLVISGKMSYHANVTMVLNFVEQVLPMIWEQRPNVRLCVVGKDPTAEIRRLGADPRIEITGSVADIRPYIHRAAVAVTPITYGVGIQNKVLEAMACGAPVVSTPQAVSALGAVPQRDVVVAEGPADLAAAITALLADPERRQALGTAGRAYVEANHRWGTIAENLEQVYRAAIDTETERKTAKQQGF